MTYTKNSSLKQFLKHPVARDIVDKLLLSMGKSRAWAYNPVTGFMRLAALDALAEHAGYKGVADVMLSLVNRSTDISVPDAGEPAQSWWRNAVIYQIYPRSFQDSNGDGIGDLQGIRSRLDYLQALGVNALWLSPICDSPQVDNGYDIRDYRAIDAQFGTMYDFEQLIEDMHSRGMKFIMDMVLNHSSDQHEWFISSVNDPDSPYKDYYIWRKGSPDTPPNNWTSFFGGSAWKYYPQRGEWNLHLFAEGQPDLNWDNPEVRESLFDIMRFWRGKGVDGFRLDVINFVSKADGLPDGHPGVARMMGQCGLEHYFYGPRIHQYFRELREKGLGDAYALGECGGLGRETGRLVTAPGRNELDEIIYFDHLETPGHSKFDDYFYDLSYAKGWFTKLQTDTYGGLWDALFWENHDNPRMVSKVNQNPSIRAPLAKLLNLWLLTLRGTPFIYQGQELGMTNADFTSIDQINDIESRNIYAEISAHRGAAAAMDVVRCSTRDHARVPMPWQPYGGFTTGKPWLMEHQDVKTLCVESQEGDDRSVLAFTRRAIALRSQYAALLSGSFTPVAASRSDVFCFTRRHGDQVIYVELNITNIPVTPPARPDHSKLLLGSYGSVQSVLRPYEGNVYLIG